MITNRQFCHGKHKVKSCVLLVCLLSLAASAVADQVTIGVDNYPNVTIVSFHQGKLIFRTPRDEDIESLIRDVDFIMVSRGRRFADFNEAEQYLLEGQPARAIPRYQRSLRTADSFWQGLCLARAITACDRAGRIEQAIEYWINLAEFDQSGVEAAVQLLPGNMKDSPRHEMNRAIVRLTKASAKQRNPDLAVLFQLLRYRMLKAIGDDQADEAAHTILASEWSKNLSHTEIYDILIDVLDRKMQQEVTLESLSRLDEAIADAPTETLSKLLLLKGHALLRLENEQESEVSAGWAFMRVVAHMPDSPDAAEGLYGAAIAMEKIGRVDKSISLLSECRDHKFATAATQALATTMLSRLQSASNAAD